MGQALSSVYVALKGTFDGRKLYYDVLSGRDSDDHSEVKFRFKFIRDEDAKAENSKQVAVSKRDEAQKQESSGTPAYWLGLSEVVGRNPMDILMLRNNLSQELNLSSDDKLRMELNLQKAAYALSGNSELLKTQTIDSNLAADDMNRKSAFDIL